MGLSRECRKLLHFGFYLGILFIASAIVSAAGLGSAPLLKVLTLPTGVTADQIQQALNHLTNGGEVLLPPGRIKISQPLILDHNGEILCGASNETTILYLMNDANCPVIIMGQPINRPMQTIRNLRVQDLFIDGNRTHQQRELWREKGEGSEIRNNGITIQNVSDSLVENVTCTRCRSGGLVTTLGVRRLAVKNFDSSNNEFDGLACYLTMDSTFEKLHLHDNPGAGISLDLSFDHNAFTNAVLENNDLGIFMRDSSKNRFSNVRIRNNRDFGVFMAQAFETVDRGPQPEPDTECTDNSFISLVDSQNGRAAFRINDAACTNNVIIDPQPRESWFAPFVGAVRALSTPTPDLVTVK
ncbi:MAG TPA: right-handed parallel beta-helix repeat-containing protein [Verrucomicrobiae bacterium]|nr:right-handed parallel beta-helix repeat-containing protein [Verrucomicrobiae bacterium]